MKKQKEIQETEIILSLSAQSVLKAAATWLIVLVTASISQVIFFPAEAHHLGFVEQEIRVSGDGETLIFSYNTKYDINLSYIVNPYLDDNMQITSEERTAFLEKLDNMVRPNLSVTLDGVRLKFDEAKGAFFSDGGLGDGMFTSMKYSVDLKKLTPGEHKFRIDGDLFIGIDETGLAYTVEKNVGALNIGVSDNKKKLTFYLLTDKSVRASQPPVEPATSESKEKTPIISTAESSTEKEQETTHSREVEETSTLTGFVRDKNLSAGMIFFALGTAFLLGMTHALSPGHGKTMVAAYLIGSRGRIRDAVFLGGIVTFTHVFSVIVLGVLVLFISHYIVPQKIYPWLGFTSGTVVFLVGYWILASRALSTLGHHHHNHEHHQNHGHYGEETSPDTTLNDSAHSHSHENENYITPGSLLALGVAGGMVPCPAALVVLLLSVSLNRIAFGLGLIIVFSLGLAIILILIGTLTVTASKFTAHFSSQRKWIQRLPVLSAGIIMLIGISMAFNALLTSGIISINL